MTAAQHVQHFAQAFGVVRRKHTHAQQATVVLELRGGADSIIVGTDQRDL